MPAGIEFACPHCLRVTRVPVTLAGKQGRCSGCRKVIQVPSGVPASGRTPDPEEGLLEVLDARRASERVPQGRASERHEKRRPSEKVPQVEPPAEEDEGSTARIDLRVSPPGPEPFRIWSRRVPPRVWVGLVAAVIVPALGIILCVLGLRQARQRGAGVRLAWTGIGIGGAIMAYNLALFAWIVLRR